MRDTTAVRQALRPAALRLSPLAALAALLLSVVVAGMPGFSSAAFTAQSANPANTVAAASDWTPPVVSVQAPAPAVAGATTVTASATDDVSGVATVAIQYQLAGAGAWTSICTATTSPYGCAWDTRTVPDGTYNLRAIATDRAGNPATSANVSTVVDNTAPLVTMADPGNPLTGTVTVSANASDTGAGIAGVNLAYAPSGTSNWITICQPANTPYSCPFDTTALANDVYDFRAIATDKAGNVSLPSVVTGRQVSNNSNNIGFGGVGAATGFSSSGTATVAYPSGTVQGDLLLLIEANNANQAITTPSGWNLLADQATPSPSQFRYTVWWRAAGTETSVPLTVKTNSSGASAWVVRYTKPSGGNPVALAAVSAQQGVAGAQATVTPSPDITTNAPARVISLTAVRGPNSLSLATPRSFTLHSSQTSNRGTPAPAIGIADAWVVGATTPASPTWAQSGTIQQWAWATVAFK